MQSTQGRPRSFVPNPSTGVRGEGGRIQVRGGNRRSKEGRGEDWGQWGERERRGETPAGTSGDLTLTLRAGIGVVRGGMVGE